MHSVKQCGPYKEVEGFKQHGYNTSFSLQTSLYLVQSILAIDTPVMSDTSLANSSQVGARRLQCPHLEQKTKIKLFNFDGPVMSWLDFETGF